MTSHTPRSRRGPALAGSVALLLGVGLAPALATPASAHAPGHRGHHASTTLRGFAATPVRVRLGGTVVDQVAVLPRAHRIVRVQARRPGGTAFVTVSSGFSSSHGDFRATYRPTKPGTWRYRLLLPATTRATRLVSVSRAVTATTDTTAPGRVIALTVVQGTASDLTLSWTNPTAKDFAGVMIRRAVGPAAPASPTAGVLVTRTSKAATSYTDHGPAGDTTYSYALFAFDQAQNKAPGANATATSGAATTAALTIGGFTGTTVKRMTVNQAEDFDITGSHAGKDLTLVSGSLDYGDGSAPETFSGDPATWVPSGHQYAAAGTVTATWTVVDSASRSVSKTVTIKLFAEPTASVVVTSTVLEKNKPITFTVTSATPTNTSFTEWDAFSGTGENFLSGLGKPTTFDITFATPGTYTVTVEGFNDAGGVATATVPVVIIDAPNP